jgi:hypothetical protein
MVKEETAKEIWTLAIWLDTILSGENGKKTQCVDARRTESI